MRNSARLMLMRRRKAALNSAEVGGLLSSGRIAVGCCTSTYAPLPKASATAITNDLRCFTSPASCGNSTTAPYPNGDTTENHSDALGRGGQRQQSHSSTTASTGSSRAATQSHLSRYTNFNEALTARECISKYGHVGANQIATVAFDDDGMSVSIIGAYAHDSANPAGSGNPSWTPNPTTTPAATSPSATAAEKTSTPLKNTENYNSNTNTNNDDDAADSKIVVDSSTSGGSSAMALRPAVIRIGGRVVSIRDMGKVVFVTIRSDGELIQLAANVTAEFYPTKEDLRAAITDVLNTGDVVGAEGTVGRTKKGELTVFIRNISVLAPYVCADMAVCPDSRMFSVVAGGGAGQKKTEVGKQKHSGVTEAAKASGSAPPQKDANSSSTAPSAEETDKAQDICSAPKELSKSQLKKLKKKQEKAAAAAASNEGGAVSTEPSASSNRSVVGVEKNVTEKEQEKVPSSSSVVAPVAAAAASPSNVISDPDLRYRYRFVDLLARPQGLKLFKLRHKVISSLRKFLDDKSFTEVETPMFHTIPCGANARPFMTHHNSNNSDLYLRIAPELYLKQCVVGGLERVYEIGKVFRNEDTDKSHNPEFTSCEFYAAYKNYIDLMGWTEELLRFIAKEATGTTILQLPTSSSAGGAEDALSQPLYVEIDLSKPFRRVSVLDEIEIKTGVVFPTIDEINSSFGIAFMAAVMLKHDIQPPTIRTPAKFLDKLIDHFITDNTTEPIFVCDHPLFMSPLAKEHEWQEDNSVSVGGNGNAAPPSSDSLAAAHSCSSLNSFASSLTATSFPLFSERNGKRGLSERFELFINGMEVCNAYSELCDPNEQLRRFEQQLQAKEQGDDEAMEPDETFLKALQVGLPPTAGWGMGIDRLVMLLSGHASIRDVILFPLLKPQNDLSNRRRSKTAGFFGFNQNMTMFALSSLEAELKRRGDRAGCEQLKRTKRIVQQAARNPELHRKQLMVELEKGLAMQREQFWWLHGADDEKAPLLKINGLGVSRNNGEEGKGASSDSDSKTQIAASSVFGATAVWPPTSPSALAALMGFSSKPPMTTNTNATDPQEKTYTTTASISSSSSTATHTTTTTTTTTTTINAHPNTIDSPSPSASGRAAATSHQRDHIRAGLAIHNMHASDAWSRWRRLAYRHNPFWKFVVRYCGGRNE